jgi:AcrR family transcriptional regulator
MPKPRNHGPRARPVRRPSQAERREATRTKILEATLDSLAKNGYAATGVRQVVSGARVSRGAWSHHFPSMDALILAAAQHLMAKVYERFGAIVREWSRSGGGMQGMVTTAWREFFASEVNDVYLELLIASRRDRKLAGLLRSVAAALDGSVSGVAEQSFAPLPGAVSTPAEVMMFNRWVLRGLALDAHLIPRSRVDAYLAAWSRLVGTQLRARFGETGA